MSILKVIRDQNPFTGRRVDNLLDFAVARLGIPSSKDLGVGLSRAEIERLKDGMYAAHNIFVCYQADRTLSGVDCSERIGDSLRGLAKDVHDCLSAGRLTEHPEHLPKNLIDLLRELSSEVVDALEGEISGFYTFDSIISSLNETHCTGFHREKFGVFGGLFDALHRQAHTDVRRKEILTSIEKCALSLREFAKPSPI